MAFKKSTEKRWKTKKQVVETLAENGIYISSSDIEESSNKRSYIIKNHFLNKYNGSLKTLINYLKFHKE